MIQSDSAQTLELESAGEKFKALVSPFPFDEAPLIAVTIPGPGWLSPLV